MQVKNWSLNDLLLQMTYAAAQAVQSVPQPAVSASDDQSDSGTDFKTLLDSKRSGQDASQTTVSASSDDTTQNSGTTVQSDGTAMEQTAAALAQPQVLTAMDLPVQTGAQTQMPQQVQAVTGNTEILPQTETSPVLNMAQQTVSTAAMPAEEPVIAQMTDQTASTATADQTAVQQPQVSDQAAKTVSQTAEKLPETAEVSAEAVNNTRQQEDDLPETVSVQSDGAGQTLFQSKSEMPQRVGDAPVLDAESEDFPVQLSKTLNQALDQGSSRIELRLTPENLGTVTVQMEHSPEGVLRVVLHAENPQTAKLLSEHSGTLGLLLQSGRQDEVRVEVPRPQENQQSQHQLEQDGSRGQNGRQQQERRQENEDPERFLQQLRLGLLPLSEQ